MTKRQNTYLLSISFFLIPLFLFSQDKTTSLSVKQAIDYAISNNTNVLNAQLDYKSAKERENEIRGIGLPQISGSFDVKDFIELPTQLLPAEVFGGPAGTFIPVQFGTKFNSTGGIQASQIIFNPDYFVAITSKGTLKELAEKNVERTKIETSVAVSKAYYNVLVNRKRLKLLEANVQRIGKLNEDTKALFENGFVEKIDADRVEVTYNNLLVEKEKTERLVGLSDALLKFQMGMDINTPVVLTDSLSDPAVELKDSLSKSAYQNRVEYSLLETTKKLNEAELRKNRMGYIPSLVFYGSLNAQQQSNRFEIFNSNSKWYTYDLIGGTLSLPIFDGLQRHYRIQQSKISVMKADNNLKALENAINLEISSAEINFKNAYTTLSTQKRNMELAENVYNVSKIKYDQGVGSNLEVMNAETALKEAQTNYYNALTDYYIFKVDYDKATGAIK